MSAPRLYDLVVLGATGYTGKLTAEFIATNLPIDLKWAIAGRSSSKLQAIAAGCKTLNPDRIQPAIEICNLNDEESSVLAKKTTLLIAAVGPYSLHGEHTFKACAENGTHYLDITGEVVWVTHMIKKYESIAQASGSIMIPQIGLDSAPADMVTWALVDMIRKEFSAPTKEVILSVKISGMPSGGTLNTVFSLMDVYSLKDIVAAHKPYALSPIPRPKIQDPAPWATRMFGVRTVPGLGILTTYFFVAADKPLVGRSWGLLGGPDFYGPNFHFSEYMKVGNHFAAVMVHFGLVFGSILLSIPLFRKFMKGIVTQPGEGASEEQSRNDRLEYKAIGNPDVQSSDSPKAICKAAYKGSAYQFTAACISSAAISILRDEHKLTGGIYTPACLGQKFVDRLETAGFKFEKTISES
ncbi:Uncharacterized protein BP5553_07587 [Venustampulla echinocandica]|uniref:Saccharopine dehydrogenase NADP binding domain-containing protein n=1 Tax=Venustampulla echinocandica TaxID=2656787 RepID=A0A370TGY1_9HELO|nr:Uncharacterized protein BP5553_07587 [Venustampulla echinocandica]RDL34459.1 Uncharacterized protein BP5553_07587 [Venustampulla echinocandica]